MASLVKDKSGNFLVAFRWANKQFTRSLDTQDEAVAEADVQTYHNKRVKETWHGEPTKARTIKKELATLRYLWGWGLKHGLVPSPPFWEMKGIDFTKEEREREFFRTMKEIRETDRAERAHGGRPDRRHPGTQTRPGHLRHRHAPRPADLQPSPAVCQFGDTTG